MSNLAKGKFQHRSACTGKGCVISEKCGRVSRASNRIYTGPLNNYFDNECVDYSMFIYRNGLATQPKRRSA